MGGVWRMGNRWFDKYMRLAWILRLIRAFGVRFDLTIVLAFFVNVVFGWLLGKGIGVCNRISSELRSFL